jgi:hypothetical protein
VPADWSHGVELLRESPTPCAYPTEAWQQLIVDAKRFLDLWSAQAATLGWQEWELVGFHCRAPWCRIQGMGLDPLLRGKEFAALTDGEAVIRTATGAHQAFRRKPRDPLHPSERCLVWELTAACASAPGIPRRKPDEG